MMKGRVLAALVFAAFAACAGDGLYESFLNPPRSAAPHVWWHWMNGNVTKEGITADLEAMKDVGLAGAQSFDCGCGIPFGGVKFASGEWFDMVLHAHNEAKRLGLELCLANCSGYSSSGGPWVTPEDSMKELVVEEAVVEGGEEPVLPVTVRTNGFYRDIAVVAFPTPAPLSEVSAGAKVEESVDETGKVEVFSFDFGSPREFSEFRCTMDAREIIWGGSGKVKITVEVEGEDGTWRKHAELSDHATPACSICGQKRYYRFPKAKAAKARVSIAFGGKWSRKLVRFGNAALGVFGRMPDYAARALYFSPTSLRKVDPSEVEKGVEVASGTVVELKNPKFDADGTLKWRAPAGRWTVLRVGYRCSGRVCAPASTYGYGLEVDKLDAAALERFFNSYVGKLVKICGIDPKSNPVNRPGFNMVLVDSWEVGSQNWTHGFEEVFRKERGYSIVKYLPALAGFVVDSPAETDRFYDDFRKTVEDAFAVNYADKFASLCHDSGLLLEIEPYSPQPCSSARYARNVDCPMSEFWCVDKVDSLSIGAECKYVASVGHVRGRKYLGAESFTSFPNDAGWKQTPWSYKAIGDLAYAHGVNRIVYHRYAHQPWVGEDAMPGMTMGMWGTHFERTLTWWPYAKDWIKYETRCQYLLQEGVYKADALVYVGKYVPRTCVGPVNRASGLSKSPILPMGFDYDFIGPDSLGELAVTPEGNVKVPGGVEYRFLVVPDDEKVDLPGAKVVKYSEAVGFVESSGMKSALETDDKTISYLRRGYSDGTEAWFVSSYCKTGHVAEVVLRETSGRVPEIWDAITGRREIADFSRLPDGRASVRIAFPPYGSCFVVFSDGGKAPPAAKFKVVREIPVDGPWKVEFLSPRRGAPESIALDALADLSKHEIAGVRHFSGVCKYRKRISLDPEAVRTCAKAEIDLGAVGEIARVKANGVYAPVVTWMRPCRADITAGVAKAAENSFALDLEIEVVNTWVNRIIGDILEGYAPDWEWKGSYVASVPDYVKKGEKAPSGRHAFYMAKFYTEKDADKIPPSGLMGPVVVRVHSPE